MCRLQKFQKLMLVSRLISGAVCSNLQVPAGSDFFSHGVPLLRPLPSGVSSLFTVPHTPLEHYAYPFDLY